MKKILFFFPLVISLFLSPLPAKGEEEIFPSPPLATVAGQVTPEKNEEIKKIREEVKKAVEKKVKEVINQRKKRAWLGTIKEKDNLSLTLETPKGEKRQVFYSEETVVINLKRKPFELDDLTIGKRIVAMGYLEGETTLEGRRIVLLEEKEERKRKPVVGIISDKSKAEKLIVVTPARHPEETIEMTISETTVILLPQNQKGDYQDLSPGQKIVAIYQSQEEKINEARKIRIIKSK